MAGGHAGFATRTGVEVDLEAVLLSRPRARERNQITIEEWVGGRADAVVLRELVDRRERALTLEHVRDIDDGQPHHRARAGARQVRAAGEPRIGSIRRTPAGPRRRGVAQLSGEAHVKLAPRRGSAVPESESCAVDSTTRSRRCTTSRSRRNSAPPTPGCPRP